MSDCHIVKVEILNKEYKIKCPPEDTLALRQAAKHIDEHMHQLKQNNQIASIDDIAIVTALNFCHEGLKLKNQKNQLTKNVNDRLCTLQKKIRKVLESE